MVTEWPSEEHSYSVATLPVEDVDEDMEPVDEYDWGSEDDDVSDVSEKRHDLSYDAASCHSAKEEVPTKRPRRSERKKKLRSPLKVKLSLPGKRQVVETDDDDEDEKLKIVEGADALLNLAGIKTSSLVPSLRSGGAQSNNNNEDKKGKLKKELKGKKKSIKRKRRKLTSLKR